MSTTIDLFAEQPTAEVVQGEPAGDVQDVQARVHPSDALSAQSTGTTSPAASGNVSSAGQEAGSRGTAVREAATRTPPARAAGCCGGCGEWTKNIVTGFGFCEHLPKWTQMSPRAECHFNPSRWVEINAEIIAKREAQAGIDRAADEADQNLHGWSDHALEFVKTFAESNRGKQFIAGEIIAASLQTDLPQPMDIKAWGRPLQQAARRRLIKRVGLDSSRVPLWEAA